MKTLLRWSALALAVAAVLVIAHDPLLWQRYLIDLLHGDEWPMSFYQPRELVPGGNEPPAPREPPASELLDPGALQAAADYAAEHNSRALIVSRHGYIVFEQYWQGSNFDTVVDSRSLGRIVTALAVGAAVSQRKIGWPDEPIGYLVPELSRDPRGAITIRNLLQLSSGLGPPGKAGSAEEFSNDIIAQYLHLPQAAPPGTRWADQSADPELLAFVVQRATGQRYADFISQSIWRPIGAADASVWLDRSGGDAHVDHGFLTRQGDWIRVAELLLENGRYQGAEVIPPKWLPQMLQPAKTNSNYGAYVHLGAHAAPGMTPFASSDVFVVEGGGNRLWLVPSLKIGILRTGSGDSIGAGWDEGRIPNLIMRGARDFVPAAAKPGADLRQLVPNH